MLGSGARIVPLPKPRPPGDRDIRAVIAEVSVDGAFGGNLSVGPINANPDVILFSVTETTDRKARIILRRRAVVEFALKLLEGVFDEADRKVIRSVVERLLR